MRCSQRKSGKAGSQDGNIIPFYVFANALQQAQYILSGHRNINIYIYKIYKYNTYHLTIYNHILQSHKLLYGNSRKIDSKAFITVAWVGLFGRRGLVLLLTLPTIR